MRRQQFEKAVEVAVCAGLLGCSEWRLKPTFPEHAAGKPVLHEQAILGISDEGSALVAQLVSADGEGPHLSLLLYYRDGAPTRSEMVAPAEAARAVAEQVLAAGPRPAPLLGAAGAPHWPPPPPPPPDLGLSPRPPACTHQGR